MREEYLEILKDIFLFKGTDLSPVLDILEQADICTYDKSYYIYSEECYRKALGVILDGRADILKGPMIILNTIFAGDCFGVAALFHENERYVSSIVAQRSTTVLYLSDEQLTEIFSRIPQTAINYIAFLSERICFLNKKLDSFTAPSAESRTALFLLENADGDLVSMKSGYSALARFLGMGRASLYRCLERLESAGAIERADKSIKLLNRSILLDLAPQSKFES